MSEIPTSEGRDKAPERRVKSVNFTDQALYDYASQRADNLYGGNFSGYVTSLIERDRSLGESRRTFHDLETRILRIIEPYGGKLSLNSHSFDFEIPSLDVAIEALSRFPRARQHEYSLLNKLQKIAFRSPTSRIIVVFPDDLSNAEKDRFRQFETSGIENLRVCDLTELERFLTSLAQPGTETLEDALLDQEETDPVARREGLPHKF